MDRLELGAFTRHFNWFADGSSRADGFETEGAMVSWPAWIPCGSVLLWHSQLGHSENSDVGVQVWCRLVQVCPGMVQLGVSPPWPAWNPLLHPQNPRLLTACHDLGGLPSVGLSHPTSQRPKRHGKTQGLSGYPMNIPCFFHGFKPWKNPWLLYRGNKQKFSGPNSVLIDDRGDLREAWEARGGIFIHHTSALESIRQLRGLVNQGIQGILQLVRCE